jgi:hypothetical protein
MDVARVCTLAGPCPIPNGQLRQSKYLARYAEFQSRVMCIKDWWIGTEPAFLHPRVCHRVIRQGNRTPRFSCWAHDSPPVDLVTTCQDIYSLCAVLNCAWTILTMICSKHNVLYRSWSSSAFLVLDCSTVHHGPNKNSYDRC